VGAPNPPPFLVDDALFFFLAAGDLEAWRVISDSGCGAVMDLWVVRDDGTDEMKACDGHGFDSAASIIRGNNMNREDVIVSTAL